MPTTEEELQQKRERNAKLREQLAQEEAKRVEREVNLANDLTAAQLDAEEARLKAQLTDAKEAAKVANVKEGASAPLAAAKEEMQRAVEAQKAREAAAAEEAKEK